MSQGLEEEEEEEEDSDREIQELKQKIRLRRQQIRTKNLPPVYQETEHGSEWGREHLSSASAGLRDNTWGLVRFLFGPTLRYYSHARGSSAVRKIFYGDLIFFLPDLES